MTWQVLFRNPNKNEFSVASAAAYILQRLRVHDQTGANEVARFVIRTADTSRAEGVRFGILKSAGLMFFGDDIVEVDAQGRRVRQ